MLEPAPLAWTLHRTPSPGAPVYRTAPGGWLALHDPDPAAPDRPWKLCRHGVEVDRCHTLLIAKRTADRMTAGQEAVS